MTARYGKPGRYYEYSPRPPHNVTPPWQPIRIDMDEVSHSTAPGMRTHRVGLALGLANDLGGIVAGARQIDIAYKSQVIAEIVRDQLQPGQEVIVSVKAVDIKGGAMLTRGLDRIDAVSVRPAGASAVGANNGELRDVYVRRPGLSYCEAPGMQSPLTTKFKVPSDEGPKLLEINKGQLEASVRDLEEKRISQERTRQREEQRAVAQRAAEEKAREEDNRSRSREKERMGPREAWDRVVSINEKRPDSEDLLRDWNRT